MSVFTSKPEKFHKHLTIVDAQGVITHQGDIHTATADPTVAFGSADVIFITVPADCMAQYAALILEYMAPGVIYDHIPLFYQHWSDETSRLLFACDDEVQQLCKALSDFDLSGVKSLKEHYESDTPEKMTKKISSIPAFQGLTSPHRAVDGGFIPDLSSRYFTADFSYGLAILVQIARFAGVSAPNMEATLNWYDRIAGSPTMFRFANFGITNLEGLTAFYRL